MNQDITFMSPCANNLVKEESYMSEFPTGVRIMEIFWKYDVVTF
jgi:hypothetical protein